MFFTTPLKRESIKIMILGFPGEPLGKRRVGLIWKGLQKDLGRLESLLRLVGLIIPKPASLGPILGGQIGKVNCRLE